MSDSKYIIKVLIKDSLDSLLLTEYLRDLGYIVDETYSEEWSKINLIITDRFYAVQFNRNLLSIKVQPSVIFLPIIIMLPEYSNTARWVKAGYDEILTIPLHKAELSSKVKLLLGIQKQAEYNYHQLLNNVQIGIYTMSYHKRILTANNKLLQLIGCDSFEDVKSKKFSEIGIKFQEGRNTILSKLDKHQQITGYESYWKLKSGKILYVRENINIMNEESNAINISYIGTVEERVIETMADSENINYE